MRKIKFQHVEGPFEPFDSSFSWLVKNLGYTAQEINTFKKRLGNCYHLCWELMVSYWNIRSYNLVHGFHTNITEGKIAHAWIENEDTVIDAIYNRSFNKKDYYRVFNAQPVHTYSKEQITNKCKEFGTSGPWY